MTMFAIYADDDAQTLILSDEDIAGRGVVQLQIGGAGSFTHESFGGGNTPFWLFLPLDSQNLRSPTVTFNGTTASWTSATGYLTLGVT